MGELAVRDVVIWTKHIHGDPELRAKLNALAGEEEIELVIDGVGGHWRKMSDGRDGRPTTGLTPQGRMAALWRELYATRRGESVDIRLPLLGGRGGVGQAPFSASPDNRGVLRRTREAVEAARAALLAPRGWSSEGRTMTRDEMHER